MPSSEKYKISKLIQLWDAHACLILNFEAVSGWARNFRKMDMLEIPRDFEKNKKWKRRTLALWQNMTWKRRPLEIRVFDALGPKQRVWKEFQKGTLCRKSHGKKCANANPWPLKNPVKHTGANSTFFEIRKDGGLSPPKNSVMPERIPKSTCSR